MSNVLGARGKDLLELLRSFSHSFVGKKNLDQQYSSIKYHRTTALPIRPHIFYKLMSEMLDFMYMGRYVHCRDVRGGAFSSGAGRGQKSAGRGEGENPRGGAGQKNA